MALAQGAAFVKNKFELSLMNDMLPTHLATVTALFALIYSYVNDEANKELWDEIISDWDSVQDDYEIELKIFYASLGRKLTLFILWLYGVALTLFILASAFAVDIMDIIVPLNESRTRQLPFKVEYFMSVEKYYDFYFITTIISLVYISFVAVTLTNAFWVQMIHVFGIQKLTGYKLQRVLDNVSNDDLQLMDAVFRSSLVICIQQYQKIIRMRTLIQRYYEMSASFLLVDTVICMSFSLIQFTRSGLKDSKILFQLGIILLETIIHAIFCQMFTNNAEDMANRIYSCEWYRVSPKVRKLLPLVIYQAHQPFTIKILKIVVASFVSLREIGRLTVSYYTVMNNMQ